MARSPRVLYPGAIYHVYSRGNCKKNIFQEAEDFHTFLGICAYCFKKYNFTLASYCLMSNHYHFLIQTPDANLPMIMKLINQCYAQYFNAKYQEVGYVFQGRYQAKIVESSHYFAKLLKYINNNPVEAALVASVTDWYWSSARSLCGIAKKLSFENHSLIRDQFGADFNFENLLRTSTTGINLNRELQYLLFTINQDHGLTLGEKNICKVFACKHNNLSNKEIGEVLDMNVRSVRRILQRGESPQKDPTLKSGP